MAEARAEQRAETDELAFAGAAVLADKVRAGEVAPKELVEVFLERIKALDPQLNAFRIVLAEKAMAEAEEAEKRRAAGEEAPLLGVPVAIKDGVEVEGELTTHGTDAFPDPAPEDAEMVAKLREAGAIVIGKTNLPELAIFPFTETKTWGVTRNPWDLNRTTGGSSGGSAAAVASGMIPIASASDGGGSIRIPASCCGLFGLKPSRGRVSPAPFVSGSLELAQNAGISVSVRDAAAFLDVAAGYEPGDAHWAPPPAQAFLAEVGADPGRLRIALTTEPPIPYEVDARVATVARDAADALTALGHDVIERTPPWKNDALLPWFARLWQISPALFPVQDASLLMPINRTLAQHAHATSSVEFAQAVVALQTLARHVIAFWQDVDVVLTPTLAKTPVPIGWIFEPDDPWEQFYRGAEFTPFTPLVNVTGQPAASVPFGTADGLPVGIQLIGPPAGEAVLFRLASQLEQAHPWAERLPTA
jgi:amidase